MMGYQQYQLVVYGLLGQKSLQGSQDRLSQFGLTMKGIERRQLGERTKVDELRGLKATTPLT